MKSLRLESFQAIFGYLLIVYFSGLLLILYDSIRGDDENFWYAMFAWLVFLAMSVSNSLPGIHRLYPLIQPLLALTLYFWILYKWEDAELEQRYGLIYEQWHVFQHFNSNIGGWQGPWDKHLFGYLPQMFGLLYLPAMYSSIFMVYRSVQQSEWPVILTSSWLIIVVTTLSFATTKTPSATYVALPMFLVAMGYASDQAIYQRHSRHALAWGTCLLLSVTKILSDRPLIPALAEGLKPLAPTLSENPRIFAQILLYLIVFWLVVTLAPDIVQRGKQSIGHLLVRGTVVLLAGLMGILLMHSISITGHPRPMPSQYQALGEYVRTHMSNNACLLLEKTELRQAYYPNSDTFNPDRLYFMFYADRSVYEVPHDQIEERARDIFRVGGEPYLVTKRAWDLPTIKSFGSWNLHRLVDIH
ncbi:hypothetical protein IH992_27750 [Candidatus Poribacteria bacterium]|nr:hypothetical protein [Candidatus Poribacteria bacterium]